MAIPFYVCEAHGGSIIQIDDPSVVNDLTAAAGTGGNAFTADITTAPVSPGVGGFGKFRKFVQRIEHDGDVDVDVTAYADGVETEQTISRDLDIGDNPVIDVPFAAVGSEFQVKIELSNFTDLVSLGSAAMWVVPKRQTR